MSDADAAALDATIAALFADPTALSPGLWVKVVDPAKGTFRKTYGKAVIGGADSAPEQHFRIGSVTKTFTATAALLLVQDGLLKLTDTVTQMDPELAAKFPAYGPITLQQLLAMQSGVEDFLNRPDGVAAEVVKDPSKLFTADELIASALTAPVQPAGTVGYSSTNYVVIEQIIAKVAGKPLRDVIAERITGPLGMTNTVLPAPEDAGTLPDPHANAYATAPCAAEFAEVGAIVEPDTDTTNWSMSAISGAGSMYSTIDDLMIWAQSTSGNSLLSEEMQAKRLEITDDPSLHYGLGVMQFGQMYGHEGDAFGMQALELFNPTTGQALAIGSNTCGNSALLIVLAASIFPDANIAAGLG